MASAGLMEVCRIRVGTGPRENSLSLASVGSSWGVGGGWERRDRRSRSWRCGIDLGWAARGRGRPKSKTSGVPHGPRPKLSGREPVLVTLKVRKEIDSLRVRRVLRYVTAAMAKAVVRFGVRIVEYSVQRDHVHLLVEAVSKAALSRAMKGVPSMAAAME